MGAKVQSKAYFPFWKVTSEGSSKGYGIVGVLEANFIEPAHEKQDFERSFVFSRLETKWKQMQMDYWKQYCHLVGHQPDPSSLQKSQNQGYAFDQTNLIPGHPANPRLEMSGSQMWSRGRAVYNNVTPPVQPPPGFQTGFDQEVASGDSSMDIDEIRDENIQLFMRREEYLQRETALKTTVEDLEKRVADTKMKCAELSSRIDLLRRQNHVT